MADKNDPKSKPIQLDEGFHVKGFADNMAKHDDQVVLKKSLNVQGFAENMDKAKVKQPDPAPPPAPAKKPEADDK